VQTINFNKLNLQENDRLLDMGCGEGRHTIGAYIEKPINAFGFDLSYKDLQIAKERLNDFDTSNKKEICQFGVGDIDTLPFKNNSYDAVICSEVLEHVDSPEDSIKELIRVLKPGGILALSVPRYFPELVCWILSKDYQEMPGGHVRIFRHSQLKKLATNEGLRYLSFHWAHALHSPYWWLQCLFWKNKENSILVKKYHQFLVWDLMKKPYLTKILEFIFQPFIGKSVVMYFKKKAN